MGIGDYLMFKAGDTMDKKKVLFISVHPAQYRDPVLESINQYQDIELYVLTLHQVASTHKEWNIKNKFNFSNKFAGKGIQIPVFGELNFDIIKEIRTIKPDMVIIPGHYPASYFMGILYSLWKKIPYIYMADTVALHEKSKESKNKKTLYRHLVQYILNKANAIWTTGKAGKDFFVSQGISEHKIFEGLYTLDVNAIKQFYLEEPSLIMRREIRQRLNVADNDTVFLFVGKLIPSRNVMNFVKAMVDTKKRTGKCSAIIIGDGPDTTELKNYILQNKLEYIKHIEAVTYEELSGYYNACDIYVHPGSEPYSLALVEAVIAKKHVITTSEVGAAYDYVKNGYNGDVIPNHSIEALVENMLKIQNQTPDVKGIEDMYQYAVNERDVNWATKQLYAGIMYSEKDLMK